MGTIILVASMIIWALGYLPLGRDIDRTYQEKITQVEAHFNNQLKELKEKDVSLRNTLTEQKHAQILQLEFEKQSKKQENSIIGRIGKFIEPTIQPLGFDWKMGVSLLAGMAAKEIVISTMGVLYQTGPDDEPTESLISKLQEDTYTSGSKAGQKVMRPLVAISFLVFVLIYFPCVAVFAAIKKESGAWKWPLFTSFYTTSLAWIAAFTIYQVGLLLGF